MSQPNPERTKDSLNWFENSFIGVRTNQVWVLFPGLVIASALAWVSHWLSNRIGIDLLGFDKSPISPIMLALLIGLIIGSNLKFPDIFQPGFTFVVKRILKLGIIFLGIRLTIFDIFKLGSMGIPIVLICILGALLLTTSFSKWLNLPERLGVLIAVGTSICGVSAILAASPVIDAEEEESTYAIAVITVFGLIATPFLSILYQ
jgi:uncharacterized integral membrane protein (TIGR00698 family)